jgi:hypothetical protein
MFHVMHSALRHQGFTGKSIRESPLHMISGGWRYDYRISFDFDVCDIDEWRQMACPQSRDFVTNMGVLAPWENCPN